MKTKQEQIEEIKRVLIKTCKHCRPFEEDYMQSKYAEALYNAGYRKLPKGAVVLTKEECDNKVILNEDHFERALNYEREKVRKETAKEILNRINEYNLDYNWDLKEEFKKLCKDYGVEVEDDK